MSTPSLADQILMEGVDDWVEFWNIDSLVSAQLEGGQRTDRIAIAVAAVRSLLDQGLVRMGDVDAGVGFIAWEGAPDEIARRIGSRWAALLRDPLPGDIGWLENTERGDAVAKQLRSGLGRANSDDHT
jgi:hypothetical protein